MRVWCHNICCSDKCHFVIVILKWFELMYCWDNLSLPHSRIFSTCGKYHRDKQIELESKIVNNLRLKSLIGLLYLVLHVQGQQHIQSPDQRLGVRPVLKLHRGTGVLTQLVYHETRHKTKRTQPYSAQVQKPVAPHDPS